jgi:hypothetical protein
LETHLQKFEADVLTYYHSRTAILRAKMLELNIHSSELSHHSYRSVRNQMNHFVYQRTRVHEREELSLFSNLMKSKSEYQRVQRKNQLLYELKQQDGDIELLKAKCLQLFVQKGIIDLCHVNIGWCIYENQFLQNFSKKYLESLNENVIRGNGLQQLVSHAICHQITRSVT